MERLAAARQLTIAQKKEWGEILSGFETRNRYAILDDAGNPLYAAGEEDGSLLARWFLKAMRPFTLRLVEPESGESAIVVRRPFRFYFHEASFEDGQGRPLGSIVRRFAIVRRRYELRDPQGALRFELFGPALRPWTFWIRPAVDASGLPPEAGGPGRIAKRWSGLLKEAFTDADQFGVEFPDGASPEEKAALLGAVFLIDFVHFENRGS